jgi:exonuclease SbcD
MTRFSFLHAADLHLDSPFKGLTVESPAIAARIRSATFDAFENLVREAIERRVDFVVVAGDVYDGSDRSLRAQLRFRDGLARLARHGIRSFVVHGNHDPLDGWISSVVWPEGARVFGPKVEAVPVEIRGEIAAVVCGVSYPKRNEQRNLAKSFKRSDHAAFHVGLLHANVGADTGHEVYAPCELADLLAGEMDYWALGHVHTRATLAERPCVVYPGNIQGRNVREEGARGCVHVRVDETGASEVEFVPLDVLRWATLRVDVTGATAIDGVDDALFGAVDAALDEAGGRPVLCRVAVAGRTSLHADLARQSSADALLERLRDRYESECPFAWVQELSIETRPEVDLEERARAEDLLGQVLRVAAEIGDDDELLARVAAESLARLYANGRAEKALDPPSTEAVRRFLDEARLLCVDRLEAAP